MTNFKSIAIAVSILIAVAVPVLTAVKAQQALRSAPLVKFEIEPYDPRDLMYGHYLAFRIKWNWKDGAPNQDTCTGGECCLCVGEGEQDPKVSIAVCPDKNKEFPSCTHVIKGNYYGGDTFETHINRTYVDEDYALALEHIFRDKKEKFHIGLIMAPMKPLQEELYVGGMSLPEYLNKNGGQILKDQTPVH